MFVIFICNINACGNSSELMEQRPALMIFFVFSHRTDMPFIKNVMNVACPLANATAQVVGLLLRLPLTGLGAATWALLDHLRACPPLEQVPSCMSMHSIISSRWLTHTIFSLALHSNLHSLEAKACCHICL